MAASVVTSRPKAHNSYPLVNFSDLPELLPGAHSNSSSAQREAFEQRCRQLYKDEIEEQLQAHPGSARIGATVRMTSSDLVAMFPSIDPTLVRTLAEEAQTCQDALETLLKLSAAIADPGVTGHSPATPPPLNLGVEDVDKFPSLVDADGWQVVSQHQFDRDPNEDLGSAWRDRAKAAVSLPAPVAIPSRMCGTTVAKKIRERKKADTDMTENITTLLETDYDFRHKRGQHRAYNRAQFGRGSRMPSSVGTRQDVEIVEDGRISEAFDDEFAA